MSPHKKQNVIAARVAQEELPVALENFELLATDFGVSTFNANNFACAGTKSKIPAYDGSDGCSSLSAFTDTSDFSKKAFRQ